MDKIKIRFHLANGKHYMHWQVKCNDKIYYLNPNEVSLRLSNCKLHNSKKTAEGIHAGKEKTVCSWIECDGLELSFSVWEDSQNKEVRYNPRVKPYWQDSNGENIDNKVFESLITVGRKVFA